MTVDQIIDMAWVPLIVVAFCLLYGLMLIITKNPKALRTKGDNRILKNEEMYAVRGGQLLLFLAAGAALMCVLIFYTVELAFAEAVAWFLVFSVLWRNMSAKYGPIGDLQK